MWMTTNNNWIKKLSQSFLIQCWKFQGNHSWQCIFIAKNIWHKVVFLSNGYINKVNKLKLWAVSDKFTTNHLKIIYVNVWEILESEKMKQCKTNIKDDKKERQKLNDCYKTIYEIDYHLHDIIYHMVINLRNNGV